jgi:hypothetical protein
MYRTNGEVLYFVEVQVSNLHSGYPLETPATERKKN